MTTLQAFLAWNDVRTGSLLRYFCYCQSMTAIEQGWYASSFPLALELIKFEPEDTGPWSGRGRQFNPDRQHHPAANRLIRPDIFIRQVRPPRHFMRGP
jgi:hypothetical protein